MEKVNPFGKGVLNAHPLRDVDVDVTPPCDLEPFVSHRGDIIPRTREKKNMVNRVVMRNNVFSFRTPKRDFAISVMKLVSQIT